MVSNDQDQESFVHELKRITGISEQSALSAWYSIKAAPTMSPERQARIYANLYGLTGGTNHALSLPGKTS